MRILIVCLATCLAMIGCKKHETEDPLAKMVQSCHPDSEIGCPRPIFTVDDLHAAQHYYRDVLGFKIDWDHGDPPDFGAVSRGDLQIFMCQRCQGHPGGWIWVFAKNVDALYEELTRKGATIKLAPTNMPWGVREMHVTDRDGNTIRFASPIDH